MKVLNDTLHNLLNNKQKLEKLVAEVREMFKSSSSEIIISEHSVQEHDLKHNETVIAEETEPKHSEESEQQASQTETEQ